MRVLLVIVTLYVFCANRGFLECELCYKNVCFKIVAWECVLQGCIHVRQDVGSGFVTIK